MSFKAVKTTGDLGKALSDEASSFAYGSRLCRAVQLTSGDFMSTPPPKDSGGAPATCDQLEAAEKGWSKVLKTVALYGKALSELADKDAADVSGQAEGLRKAIESAGVEDAANDKAKAATKAASALTGILFDEIRRGKLKTKIREANPHVQKMVDGLVVHIVAELSVIRALRASLLAQARDLLGAKGDRGLRTCCRTERWCGCDIRCRYEV